MKPIKLYVYKPTQSQEGLTGHVRITPEAERIIRGLQRASGLSACQIASQIIVQAEDAVEIVEVT